MMVFCEAASLIWMGDAYKTVNYGRFHLRERHLWNSAPNEPYKDLQLRTVVVILSKIKPC